MRMLKGMTTKGKIGYCDAKCHNAKHDKCQCICEGRNHGCGEIEAIDIERLDPRWMTKHKIERIQSKGSKQMDLFVSLKEER